MKAVGYKEAGDSLEDIDVPVSAPEGRQLLVSVRAVSVNPVDTKVRRAVTPAPGQYMILGWDASGVVEAVGPDVRHFMPGDEVYYAGSLSGPGTNCELHLVDERIVGKKASTIDFAQAAALPLTTITAWEALFDRLNVYAPTPSGAAVILVIGGAGGVGSIAIQLLRQLTDLTIVSTASRQETRDWANRMGTHHVVDHGKSLDEEWNTLGLESPGFVFSTTATDRHLDSIASLIAPQGRLCMIDDPSSFDIMKLKRKSVSLHWETMFTRSLYETVDIDEQGKLLNRVSSLVDEGKLQTTLTLNLGKITAENIMRAHELIESGSSRGKVVLEGF